MSLIQFRGMTYNNQFKELLMQELEKQQKRLDDLRKAVAPILIREPKSKLTFQATLDERLYNLSRRYNALIKQMGFSRD